MTRSERTARYDARAERFSCNVVQVLAVPYFAPARSFEAAGNGSSHPSHIKEP